MVRAIVFGGTRPVARLRSEETMTDTQTIAETAARWHARAMLGALSPADEQRLDAWLAESMRHRLAYADVAAAGYALQQSAPSIAIPRRVARHWPVWSS